MEYFLWHTFQLEPLNCIVAQNEHEQLPYGKWHDHHTPPRLESAEPLLRMVYQHTPHGLSSGTLKYHGAQPAPAQRFAEDTRRQVPGVYHVHAADRSYERPGHTHD